MPDAGADATAHVGARPGRDSFDPYAPVVAGSAPRFLYRLNPLATLAGPVPAMIVLAFVRDLATPLAFLALTYVVLLIGVRFTLRTALLLFVAIPVAVVVVGVGFAVWADPAGVDRSVVVLQVGGWALYGGALEVGFATGLRLAAIVALGLLAGLSSSGVEVVRAMVQQLRVPYRIGYTALAAFRFVPRFGYELEVIRQAHRVRGAHGGRGPFASIARGAGYLVPLLAGAIRHAERVALAMDARAFGAYPDRTERHLVPFRVRDLVFLVASWAVSAVVFWYFFP
ncbi:energy-coupling factor transporter transmembrane component T [Microbacterium sp. P01]|uniref:energy-coupling factor transporter transmembrane component T n=1 Tax=unclassified Microbacterium TaxID=2609290 RepID=UPI00366D5AAD